MRLWSLHPKHLDAKGLVALWRETLLAKKVLIGDTKGYKNHPQLCRFKKSSNAVHFIDRYLAYVYDEAVSRGYKFDRRKIDDFTEDGKLTVTKGQLKYELKHLLEKLKERQLDKYNELQGMDELEPHPLFIMVEGEVEEWEIKKAEHHTTKTTIGGD